MATRHSSLPESIPQDARAQLNHLLDDIVESAPFRTSRQCQGLFRYIVEHSLSGADESLRERLIGVEVFARSADYDTSEDPVVRLRAADIRKRLAQYYQTHKQPGDAWKIEIPTGSYRAQFSPPEAMPTPVLADSESPTSRETARPVPHDSARPLAGSARNIKVRILLLSAASLIAVLAGLLLTRTISRASTAFDLFWEPVLASPKPTLVCTGSNPVYILSQQAVAKYKITHLHNQDATPNFQSLVPKDDLKEFTSTDFLPVKETYLTVGDASAISQISSLLSSHNHALDLRFGSDLSFGDLRQGSAILIGAFNNSWTLNMTDHLRFVFDSADTPAVRVQDKIDANRAWHPKLSQGKVVEDYAIVSRVVDSKTKSVFVTIAGLYHHGTEAAGDFVANPRMIAEFAKQAPKDWSKRNLQVVLHTNVTNDIPDSPTVVATHYW